MKYNEANIVSLGRVRSWRFSGYSRYSDRIFSSLTLVFALVIAGLLLGLVIVLTVDALPAISRFGFSFLSSSAWDPVREAFGALPAIYGTLLSSIIGLLIAVPISLGAAIFLVELAPLWLKGTASLIIEMLAAIPSVIIGLWGLFVLVPFVRTPVESWLGSKMGFLPLFQGPPFGVGFLAAGIILAIMVIPIITAISRDAMRAVPNEQREAMFALGATRWEMIQQAVLPLLPLGTGGGNNPWARPCPWRNYGGDHGHWQLLCTDGFSLLSGSYHCQ